MITQHCLLDGYNHWVKTVPEQYRVQGEVGGTNDHKMVTWEPEKEVKNLRQLVKHSKNAKVVQAMISLKRVIMDGKLAFPFGLRPEEVIITETMDVRLCPPIGDGPAKEVGESGAAVLVKMIKFVQGKLNVDRKDQCRLHVALGKMAADINDLATLAESEEESEEDAPINSFSREELETMKTRLEKLDAVQHASVLQIVHDNFSQAVGEKVNLAQYNDATLLAIRHFLDTTKKPRGRRQRFVSSAPGNLSIDVLRERSNATTEKTEKTIQEIEDELARMANRVVDNDIEDGGAFDVYNLNPASIAAAAFAKIDDDESEDSDTVSESDEEEDEEEQPKTPVIKRLLSPDLINQFAKKAEEQERIQWQQDKAQREWDLQRLEKKLEEWQERLKKEESDLANQRGALAAREELLNVRERDLVQREKAYENRKKRQREDEERDFNHRENKRVNLTENEDMEAMYKDFMGA